MSEPSKQDIQKFKNDFREHYKHHLYREDGDIFNNEENNRKIYRWISTDSVYTPVWGRNKNGELYLVSLTENVTFQKGEDYPSYRHPRKRKEQRKSRKKTRKNRKRRM